MLLPSLPPNRKIQTSALYCGSTPELAKAFMAPKRASGARPAILRNVLRVSMSGSLELHLILSGQSRKIHRCQDAAGIVSVSVDRDAERRSKLCRHAAVVEFLVREIEQ